MPRTLEHFLNNYQIQIKLDLVTFLHEVGVQINNPLLSSTEGFKLKIMCCSPKESSSQAIPLLGEEVRVITSRLRYSQTESAGRAWVSFAYSPYTLWFPSHIKVNFVSYSSRVGEPNKALWPKFNITRRQKDFDPGNNTPLEKTRVISWHLKSFKQFLPLDQVRVCFFFRNYFGTFRLSSRADKCPSLSQTGHH